MVGTGVILAAALAVVGFAAWWSLRVRSLPTAPLAIAIVAMWVTSMAVLWWRYDEPRGRTQVVQSFDSLGWPGTRAPLVPEPAPSSAPPGVQAGPVEALVGGLEARLAAQPDDAEGWTLLAQSYAYTANEEAVERAVQRAVALGADESALRERVASAKRRAPPVDWVEHAIRAGRQ